MLFCSLKIIKGKKTILYSLDLIRLLMVEWLLFDAHSPDGLQLGYTHLVWRWAEKSRMGQENSSSRWGGVSWVSHSYYYLSLVSSVEVEPTATSRFLEPLLLSWRGQSAAEPRVALLYLNPNQIYHQVALSHTQDVEPLAWNFFEASWALSLVSSLTLKRKKKTAPYFVPCNHVVSHILSYGRSVRSFPIHFLTC